MDLSVQELIRVGAERTDRALEALLPSPDLAPHSIHRAIRHSIFAGGKRLRPVLCFEAWQLVAGPGQDATPATHLGAALEMIHTYSLIHDDLPALDNDDLRRGQPTCHKLFGEAIAILAGDALQTLAFATVARLHCPADTTVRILHELTTAIGTGVGLPSSEPAPTSDPDPDLPPGRAPGMIGGQVVDIESEGQRHPASPGTPAEIPHQPPTAALVEQIHRAKTGALLTASIVTGGLLGLPPLRSSLGSGSDAARAKAEFDRHQALRAANADTISRLRRFGENAGLAFQIIDDVLDVTQSSADLGKTAGKDTATIKATWPAVFGVERSLHDARELIADAFSALEPFGEAAASLRALALYLVERKS